MTYHFSKTLDSTMDAAVARVTEALKQEGFGVLTEIDVQKTLKAKINADVLKVLADPEVKARYNTFAFETLTWSADDIRKNAEAKSKIYDQLVKRKNISLD